MTEDTRARYAVDGIIPQIVRLTASEAEVAALLREAAQADTVVVPWGAGSKQDMGNPMERVDLVLSLERMNQVVDYVPADMTITVQAGMRFSDLQELTARHGQTVPLDPARAAIGTIGGMVATGGAGPRRMAYGGVRDLLLGARIALADGRVIKAGGKVVKNVAGYDVPKLAAGSLGTLGVLTEVSLRLRPLPADRRTQLYGFPALGPALVAADAILNSELLPAAVVVATPAAARRLDAPGQVTLAVALEETPENNAYQVDRLTQMLQGHTAWATLAGEAESHFWKRLIDYDSSFGCAFRVRINTVGSDLANQIQRSPEAIAYVSSATVMLYGNGEVPAGVLKDSIAGANSAGGWAVLESGPVALRRELDVWGPPRPEWKFTEGIRKSFDPGCILNRGRYVGVQQPCLS